MKKIFTLLLAVLMVLGLAACGSKKAEEKKEEKRGDVTDICGDYVDATGKATLNISANGDDGTLMLTVTQSTTASDVTEWIMGGKFDATTNKIIYEACMCRTYTVGEDGKQGEPQTIYTDGTGYFELKDNTVLWHSNVKDEATDVTFTKNK